MILRKLAAVLGCPLILLALGCGERSSEGLAPAKTPSTPLSTLITLKPAGGPCAPLAGMVPPKDGAIFVYSVFVGGTRNDDVHMDNVIFDAGGGRVKYRETAYMKAVQADATVKARTTSAVSLLGLIVESTQSTNGDSRRYDLPPDLEQRIVALTPGQSVRFDASETSSLGTEKTVSGQGSVSYLDCGVVRLAGRDIPVNAYRVSLFYRSVTTSRDSTGVSNKTVLVAPELGWWVAQEEQGAGMVLQGLDGYSAIAE